MCRVVVLLLAACSAPWSFVVHSHVTRESETRVVESHMVLRCNATNKSVLSNVRRVVCEAGLEFFYSCSDSR